MIVGGQFDQFVRHPARWLLFDGCLLWFNLNLFKRRGKGGRLFDLLRCSEWLDGECMAADARSGAK